MVRVECHITCSTLTMNKLAVLMEVSEFDWGKWEIRNNYEPLLLRYIKAIV